MQQVFNHGDSKNRIAYLRVDKFHTFDAFMFAVDFAQTHVTTFRVTVNVSVVAQVTIVVLV